MSFIWDLVVRYSLTGRRAGFTRFVARASMLGMVVGVASLITVMSVMNGFSRELHERILSLVPDITVSLDGQRDPDWRDLASTIGRLPGIAAAAPYVSDNVLLEGRGRRRGAALTGIDIAAQRGVSELHNHIVRGELEAIDQRFSVVLGVTLARLLGVSVGDDIEVILPTLHVTPMGVFPRSRRLRVVAEFEVGASPDVGQAWVSLDTARRLFARSGVDGLALQLDGTVALDQARAGLKSSLPETARVADWRTSQGSLFTAVKMEKLTVAVLLMAVVAVAAFNIVSTLTMSVTEKRGDIAVLRVMGFSSRRIMLLFLGHGLVLGVFGILIGAVIGILLALNVSEVAAFIEGLTGQSLFDPRVYYIERLPSVLQWRDVVAVILGAVFLSTLATLYPAWRAGQIHPASVLNHG